MIPPILLTSACDLNVGMNWGQLGLCLGTHVSIGPEISFVVIIIFFVLMVLITNLKMGSWYLIAGVLATFFLVTKLPTADVAFMIWVFVVILLPALMFIPGLKKVIDR